MVRLQCASALLCLLHASVGSKVLVVFPVPSRSHTILGDAVVNTLLDAGHEVTYVSPLSNLACTDLACTAALTRVDIGSAADRDTDREHLDLVERVRDPREPAWPPQRMLEVGTTFSQRALNHDAMKEMLQDPEQTFDVVVAEWFFTGLLAPLASLYECPLVWYSAVDANWMNLQLVHGQTNPAYAADLQARHMAKATACANVWTGCETKRTSLFGCSDYMTYYVESAAYQEIYRNPLQLRGRYPPNYEDLVYNASMLLVNSHHLLGQSLALPANTKYVGGHHIEVPTKPLPKNLKQLLDNSKNGVIFFNLGSDVKGKDLPEYVKMQLLDVFEQLEQTVIWKFEEPVESLPSNVHIVKWAPQTGILNHSNTVLYITHGGFMSYMEATYFGVPVIGIPIFADQFLTTALVAARGRGIRVGFTPYLPYKIKAAVNEILGNYKYKGNAKEASAIFQNQLVSPQKELLYWIELVIHHGAGHLRSPAVRLTTVERLNLDNIAVILMFMWLLFRVYKVLKVHWEAAEGEEKKKQ